MCMQSPQGQERALDFLKLQLETFVRCGSWKLNPDLLEEQQVFISIKPSLDPTLAFGLYICERMGEVYHVSHVSSKPSLAEDEIHIN